MCCLFGDWFLVGVDWLVFGDYVCCGFGLVFELLDWGWVLVFWCFVGGFGGCVFGLGVIVYLIGCFGMCYW